MALEYGQHLGVELGQRQRLVGKLVAENARARPSSSPCSTAPAFSRGSISTIRRRCSITWNPAVVLPDVHVLVAAYRDDVLDHARGRSWLQGTVEGDEAFALSDLVLSGFLRVVTHPRVFALPSPIDGALEFLRVLRDQPHCVTVAPGPRHWGIFTSLCRAAEAKGNVIPDAYLAALAIESGCEWVTLDRDFARFEGLRWASPPT